MSDSDDNENNSEDNMKVVEDDDVNCDYETHGQVGAKRASKSYTSDDDDEDITCIICQEKGVICLVIWL